MDIWIDIYSFFTRDCLEKHQLVSRKWNKFIDSYQNILPIRGLKMEVKKDFMNENKAIFELVLDDKGLRKTLSSNEFSVQQEILLKSSIILELFIGSNLLCRMTDIKNVFLGFKKLNKPLYVYETKMMLYATREQDETFYTFWLEYFNGKIISTSILKLCVQMNEMSYYLANFSMFSLMEKGTKINLDLWGDNFHLDKKLLFKSEDDILLVEPFKLDLCYYSDVLKLIVEIFMDESAPNFLFKQYAVWNNPDTIKSLSKSFPIFANLLGNQEQCILERGDGWKMLVKKEEKSIHRLLLKIYQ